MKGEEKGGGNGGEGEKKGGEKEGKGGEKGGEKARTSVPILFHYFRKEISLFW